jgi:NADPH:quinone reductase-like Zn-dependent oxidoreductase
MEMKMKAVRIHRFGGPEVLQLDEIEPAEPGPGEVRVRVAAASINPVDYKMRSGSYPRLRESDLPAILGRDLAGVVEAIGPNVSHVVPGEPVFAHIGWDRGAYAQEVIVKVGEFAPKPETLTMLDAGSLPLAAMTAWQGLFDHGALKAGERVLIHGASGGVGYLAVQFAKLHGAEVIATASKDNLDWVRSLGADRVIDYKAQDFEAEVSDVDLVYDLLAGETRAKSWSTLKPHGRLITTLARGDVEAEGKAHGKVGKAYMAEPKADQLREVARLCDEAKLQVMVDSFFPLEQAAEAHRRAEEGHPRGKVVLEVR